MKRIPSSLLPRRTLLAAGALALAGCGFKLREAPVFSFKSIALAGNSRFVNQVRRNLSTSGSVQLVPAADITRAEAVLEILAETRERAVMSTTAAGAVRELALRLRVRFRLRAQDGKELLGSTEIAQSRDISYNETAALAKESEQELLYRDMTIDIAQQIVRQIGFVKAL